MPRSRRRRAAPGAEQARIRPRRDADARYAQFVDPARRGFVRPPTGTVLLPIPAHPGLIVGIVSLQAIVGAPAHAASTSARAWVIG